MAQIESDGFLGAAGPDRGALGADRPLLKAEATVGVKGGGQAVAVAQAESNNDTELTAGARDRAGREEAASALFSRSTASAALAMATMLECWRAATLAFAGRASSSMTSKRRRGSGSNPMM